MAKRPVFITNNLPPHYEEINTEFKYYSGFADSQRKKSSYSLKEAFMVKHPDAEVLEVSRFSENVLGQRLSAFNLLLTTPGGKKMPVENVFQAGKVFESGGPYEDLLNVSPAAAKKDPRLKSSGSITEFSYFGQSFPTEPKTFFYDWLYMSALSENEDISKELLSFNAFTDIVFNPEKSLNCQARTVAIYVSLVRSGLIEEAMKSPESFKFLVYGNAEGLFIQESLF